MSNRDQKIFYREQLARYGTCAEGMGWQSSRTQRRRFAVIEKAVGSLSSLSVADAGCGLGDFLLYLRDRGNTPARYLGLELLPELAEEAGRRTRAEIRRCDILADRLPSADWYLCSGAMNRLSPLETRLFIRRCWEVSRKGFAFNLLEGRRTSDGFTRHRSREILGYCRSLGARTRLIDDYLEGDFTIVMG